MVMDYKYFKPKEFTFCNPSCSIDQVSSDLLKKLDDIREMCGFPLIVTSAFRSVSYEVSHNRLGNSSHTKGLAVDISCITPQYRLKLIESALKCGIRRIGIYASFIHLDIDKDKNECIWTGDLSNVE